MTDETKTPEVEEPQAETTPAQPPLSPSAGMKDNKMLAWFLSTVLYPALFLGALFTSASMTFDVIGMILPGNVYMQWLAIGFFDAGALVWWLMYIIKARGTAQRGAALVIFIVDLMGAVLMIAGELWLGGQTLATPPAWLARTLINGTIAVMAGNLIAAYYYHANAPDVIAAREMEEDIDELEAEARTQARAAIRRDARPLASVMAIRNTAQVKYRLRLPMTEQERSAWDGEIVNGEVKDLPALPAPADDVPGWVKAVFRFFGNGRNSRPETSEPITHTDTGNTD